MEPMATSEGLENTVVARTACSEVDGELGRLIIAGHDVEVWAGNASFEEATAVLLSAVFPKPITASYAGERLAEGRIYASRWLPQLAPLLKRSDGMDGLRACVGALTVPDDVPEGQALFAIAITSVFAAAFARIRDGLAPLPADPELSHASDYLRMMRGQKASDAQVRAMNTYLTTVSDHGLNASTFAARVCASTGSDIISCITAAIGTLKGPLHGGAPGPVLDMLDAIASPEQAEAFIAGELAAKRRIMGMGHRIYRTRDPRAQVFEGAIAQLAHDGVTCPRLSLARAVEKVAQGALAQKYPNRSLCTNVEFYTAVLLDAIGVHRSLFSPSFAVGRVAGWCAHVQEQRTVGKLIRPQSRYVGARASREAENMR